MLQSCARGSRGLGGRRQLTLFAAIAALILTIGAVSGVVLPSPASAAGGLPWNVAERYGPSLTVLPGRGVVADTATANGGVPTTAAICSMA
jgi:hypothetical protein